MNKFTYLKRNNLQGTFQRRSRNRQALWTDPRQRDSSLPRDPCGRARVRACAAGRHLFR